MRAKDNEVTEIDHIKNGISASNGNGTDIDGTEGAIEDVLKDKKGDEADEEGIGMDGGEKEEEEGEIDLADTVELMDLKDRINNNSSFHRLPNIDTKIHRCVLCKQRMLQFVVYVHCHETHTVHVEGRRRRGSSGGRWALSAIAAAQRQQKGHMAKRIDVCVC